MINRERSLIENLLLLHIPSFTWTLAINWVMCEVDWESTQTTPWHELTSSRSPALLRCPTSPPTSATRTSTVRNGTLSGNRLRTAGAVTGTCTTTTGTTSTTTSRRSTRAPTRRADATTTATTCRTRTTGTTTDRTGLATRGIGMTTTTRATIVGTRVRRSIGI